MTVPTDNTNTAPSPEVKNDKEYNFSQLRRQLEETRVAKEVSENRVRELEMRHSQSSDDDLDSDEPYIDKKVFKKGLSKVKEETKQETKKDVQYEVQKALYEERKNQWIRQNGDFYDVMQHAQRLYEKDPELAETILEMPEGFERQKLVYKNIKAFGLHKAPDPQPSIQETIDRNKRSPYYQPSGVGAAPYANAGDYSPQGQKSAYDKMQELKNRLRM